jgi:hypothetical protein
MSIQVDPPRNPLPPVAQVLAEAALQRQNMLLGTDRAPAVPTPARGPASGGAPPGSVPAPAQPGAAPPLPPAAGERVSISPQARQSLDGATGEAAARAMAGGAGRAAAPAPALGAGRPALPVAAPAVPAAGAWPASGASPPVRSMLAAMVQQLTAPVLPQRVAGAQPWPADLARQLLDGGGAGAAAQTGGAMPPLQAWRVAQGAVQTAEGPRGFALTLRVPVPWLAALPLAQAPAAPTAPLQVPFTGSPQSLQSGVFALVLEGADPGAPRTSALLVVDFAPPPGAAVYGREQLVARMDPWTQMAVLQASGHLPADAVRERDRPLCETVGCPYAGRAPCAQPFCMALRWVEPMAGVLPAGPQA